MQFAIAGGSLLVFGILAFFMYRDIQKYNAKPKTKKKKSRMKLPEYKGKG